MIHLFKAGRVLLYGDLCKGPSIVLGYFSSPFLPRIIQSPRCYRAYSLIYFVNENLQYAANIK